jgi:hypothetical protein
MLLFLQEAHPVKTPLEAFMQWFDHVPVSLRRYLAHIFRVCTTDDTSQMAASTDQSLESFRNWALKMDFPLRIAARMFYIRSIFDMVIFHYKEILTGDDFLPPTSGKNTVINISSKQWEYIFRSWQDLRGKEMSDIFIHSWASWMIKLHMEKK